MEDPAVVVLAVEKLATPLDAILVHVRAIVAVHSAMAPAARVHSAIRPLVLALAMEHIALELTLPV